MTPLTGWGNFYVIMGSAAGALIGLQFVVITLIASIPVVRDQGQASAAFATPTIVHFAAVLLLAGVQTVPWRGLEPVSVMWGLLGAGGIVYEILIARRMRQTIYKPVFEDWLCHVVLPFAAYMALAFSGLAIRSNAGQALLVTGAAALVLLFVGIHNAWDAVTYHVFSRKDAQRESQE